MEKIRLKNLHLKNAHFKLDLVFLNKLLKDASKSEKPHLNKDFCKKINCKINKKKKAGMSIYNWVKGTRTINLSQLTKVINLSNYSWEDVEKNLISIKAGIKKGEVFINFPIIVDEKLGSIIGHIIGDGAIDRRDHYVFYSNSNIHLLKEVRNNMKSIFGIEPRIWIQERRKFEEKSKWLERVNNLNKVPKKHCVGLFYPKICGEILHSICGKFAEGRDKKITSKIKEMNKDFQRGFIRAFFDDECSVRSKDYTIRFHQDNKLILEEIRQLLKNFNINTNSIKSCTRRGKLRHYFNLTSFKEYSAFFDLIGCTTPNKKKEFELLINKVKNSKKYAICF